MKTLLLVPLLAAFAGVGARAQSPSSTNPDVIYIGTVTALTASALGQSDQNWVVVTDVLSIEAGQFSGKTFSFRIHSPARAGLVVGQRYRVQAMKRGDGYVVDEFHIQPQD